VCCVYRMSMTRKEGTENDNEAVIGTSLKKVRCAICKKERAAGRKKEKREKNAWSTLWNRREGSLELLVSFSVRRPSGYGHRGREEKKIYFAVNRIEHSVTAR